MRASGLGKVSRDKRWRATTSDNTIAAGRDECNWRCSHREAPAPKRSRHKPLKREEEGRGNQLRSHNRPRQQVPQDCCEDVVSITTKLISRRQLSLQVRWSPRNKPNEHSHEARWPSQQETPNRSGKFTPLISYDASVGIKKKCQQQRQKLRQNIVPSTSATMTIAVIVAKMSRATTRTSSAAIDGKESANKSSDYWSAGNYHLVVLSKNEDGW
jgi:hypothetical protein